MDLLDHGGRALRLLAAAIIAAMAGAAVVAVFSQVLAPDYSRGQGWFAVFTWGLTFVLVTVGLNALFSYLAKRWHAALESPIVPFVAPIPVARVVRR